MSNKTNLVPVKLIVNPGAGVAANSAKNLRLVTAYLKESGLQPDVVMAKPKERATSIARKAIKDGFKIVIAMGGDGTLEAVMRGMVGSKVRMGIIPAGTENNIAISLGIPRDLEKACELIASQKTLKLDMGQITNRKGKKTVFFEMASIGLSAAVYPSVAKMASRKLIKLKDAVMTIIRRQARPVFSLTMNDESKVEVETMLVMVSNTPVFGKKFLVAPGASLQDGLLDISVYPDFSKAELLSYYAAVMNGGYSGDGKVQHYQARKIMIKSSPKLDVMADGMELGKGTVKIKALPKALRVIAAKPRPQPKIEETQAINLQPIPESAGMDHKVVSVIKLD